MDARVVASRTPSPFLLFIPGIDDVCVDETLVREDAPTYPTNALALASGTSLSRVWKYIRSCALPAGVNTVKP